jgi:hypothetical protein
MLAKFSIQEFFPSKQFFNIKSFSMQKNFQNELKINSFE